jgi:hypothetical protein
MHALCIWTSAAVEHDNSDSGQRRELVRRCHGNDLVCSDARGSGPLHSLDQE